MNTVDSKKDDFLDLPHSKEIRQYLRGQSLAVWHEYVAAKQQQSRWMRKIMVFFHKVL